MTAFCTLDILAIYLQELCIPVITEFLSLPSNMTATFINNVLKIVIGENITKKSKFFY